MFEGEPDGEGVLNLLDGSVYVGTFSLGLKHGKGRMEYANGEVYDGGWMFDRYSG